MSGGWGTTGWGLGEDVLGERGTKFRDDKVTMFFVLRSVYDHIGILWFVLLEELGDGKRFDFPQLPLPKGLQEFVI